MITSGVISFEDGVKADQEYAPPRKVRVELHFAIDPTLDAAGVDTTCAAMGEKEKGMVYGMLGSKAPAKKAAPKAAVTADTAPKDAAKADYAKAAETAPAASGAADMAEFDVKPKAAEEDHLT